MEFMLLFTAPPDDAEPDPRGFEEMGKYARDLAAKGVLRRGAPLASPSHATCVRVRDGRSLVSDGPFAESKEVIAGFWVIEAADRDEAIEIARRSPHARHANVAVHRLQYRGDFGDSEKGTPFLLVFRMEPGLRDDDGAKGREMRAFGEPLAQSGTLLETGRLADQEPPAVVRVRGGRTFVTDGPFAESKEAVGGYGLVRAADRAEATSLAERFPHARWGPVEVREILFFDRV